MKIGICCGADKAELAKAAGCDYLEMHFTNVTRMDDQAFEQTLAELARVGMPCEAMNCLLPADFALASPELDTAALGDFLTKGFARAKRLGAQVVVFGAGRARRLPEGMSKQSGWEILTPICRLAGDIAAKHGIVIAIEPLRDGECNVVNTLRDGLALMNLAGHPNVRLLADMFHMARNGEDMQDITLAGADLWHCHVASPEGRLYPMPDDGCDDAYAAFFAALRGTGYTGRMTIEADGAPSGDATADLPISVALLHELE
ncbi:MAG: sugar phosphate isomerase/epimerase [Oscillospiraceae bacterium]|nr:sugar phosphate isomerase/epimerase [Oscillospiraceae bacterium]